MKKEISLSQAVSMLEEGKPIFYQEDSSGRQFRILKSIKELIDLKRKYLLFELGITFFEDVLTEPDRSRVVVRRDITFIEAMQLMQEGRGIKVWYFDVHDANDWVPLVGNVSVDRLVATKFQAEFKARSISFDMVPRIPPASKRNAFEFQNAELDISIYGKKGTIPHSGKGIRVQITEII